MNRRITILSAVLVVLLITDWMSTSTQAQEDSKAAAAKKDVKAEKAPMKGDKTGTNPINFTHDSVFITNINF